MGHVGANRLRSGIKLLKRYLPGRRRSIDTAEQYPAGQRHRERGFRARIGAFAGKRERIAGGEARQIVPRRLDRRSAPGDADPLRADSRREIVDKIRQCPDTFGEGRARLRRQAARYPVGFSAGIMIYFSVVEELELRRGPRAEVSQAVAAVGNHRTAPIERRGGLPRQVAQRQMKRALDMDGVVLERRKRFDYLGATASQAQ